MKQLTRIERMELEHLRMHVAELEAQLAQAKIDLEYHQCSADFWQGHSMNLQESLHDEDAATHRCIGLSKSGELMVVKLDNELVRANA